MKTTLDIPDDLLSEAKAVAARRRITLKDMVAHALRREIMPSSVPESALQSRYEVGPFGILRLPKRSGEITSELIRDLETEVDAGEFERSINLRGSL